MLLSVFQQTNRKQHLSRRLLTDFRAPRGCVRWNQGIVLWMYFDNENSPTRKIVFFFLSFFFGCWGWRRRERCGHLTFLWTFRHALSGYCNSNQLEMGVQRERRGQTERSKTNIREMRWGRKERLKGKVREGN